MGVISWAPIPPPSQEKYVNWFKAEEVTDERLLLATERTVWSPIVWKDGYRLRKNFLFSDYCALDFENADVSIESIARAFADSWHIIGTTRNHRLQKAGEIMDRFRLILRWQHRITSLEEYEYNTKRLQKHYGSDSSATDGAKRFFPSKVYTYQIGDDPDLFWEEVLPPVAKEYAFVSAEYEAKFHRRGKLSPQTTAVLTNVLPPGHRNTPFFMAACELARAGFPVAKAAEIIFDSPTFANKNRDMSIKKLVGEIRRTIKSAYENTLGVIIDKSLK